MSEEKIAVKIWRILYPFLFYYAIMLISMTLMQCVFGADKKHYVLCQLLSTLITIPFMLPFYRETRLNSGKAEEKPAVKKEILLHVLSAVFIAGFIGTALNNIISMTPLVEMSESYKEVNEHFYGSTLALELVSSAFLTPVLEELVYRGIIFTRLKRMMPRVFAVVLSALVFSLVHFNIVQFIYALFLGIVLALLMERANHVYASIAGHMTVNFLAVLRTETGILANTVKGNVFSWVVSAVLLLAGLLLLVLYLFFDASGDKNISRE